MAVCFAVDAATDPPEFNDGLWPVGAVSMFLGVLLGVSVVSCITAALRGLLTARAATSARQQG
jgi:hypothetical protein